MRELEKATKPRVGMRMRHRHKDRAAMVVWVSEDGMAAKLRLPDGREQAWYAMELDAVWTPAREASE